MLYLFLIGNKGNTKCFMIYVYWNYPFRVELIGLGNGTACRETEFWLKFQAISQNIPVVVVPEQGASIYSISKEAQKVIITYY